MPMENGNRPPRLRVMGLWKNKNREGVEYMAGNLGPLRIEIWPNDRQQGENPPDFNLSITEARKREDRGGRGGG